MILFAALAGIHLARWAQTGSTLNLITGAMLVLSALIYSDWVALKTEREAAELDEADDV